MIDGIEKEKAVDLYRKIRLIRRFEENVIELVNKNEIYGTTHEYIGEEAVAAGICESLNRDDYIMSTHRGHGHIIAKGGDLKFMFAELFGKVDGYNRGKGGSMHIADLGLGILGANGIVGAGVPIAAGAGLAIKVKKASQIVVSFYGDGAANQGVVHEAMNMAAIWNLPILFVCENNMYAVSTSVKYSSKIEKLSDRSKAYGFKGKTIDGMDVSAVYNSAKKIINEIRAGNGPFLLECKTYRFKGHFTAEHIFGLNYRTEDEINYFKSKCPMVCWGKRLIAEKVCTDKDLEEINDSVEKLINDAIEFARRSNLPAPEDALKEMYASPYNGIPQKGWI